MDDEMKAYKALMITEYREMINGLDGIIAEADQWNQTYPKEQPIDVGPFRVNRCGAVMALAAVENDERIPENALRMLYQEIDTELDYEDAPNP